MTTVEFMAHRIMIIGFLGHEMPIETADLLKKGVGGAILFARNVVSPSQVANLNKQLKNASKQPLLCSVDQEGGRVARLRAPWALWPAMRQFGTLGDEKAVRALGVSLAQQLKSCGFDVDYAPVLDVDSNPDNPIIGDRSFSRDPHTVGKLGSALIQGLQSSGVGACGKHFPGHGDTSQDSHLTLPRLPHGMERLESLELIPFVHAINANVASIMTAHVVFEALDADIPATMSKKAIDGILRQKMKYDGVVISDDLEMKAVHEKFEMKEVVEKALNAGVDSFLACKELALQHEVIEIIIKAVESGRVPKSRLEQAFTRVERMISTYACTTHSIDEQTAERVALDDAHRQLALSISPAISV